jgi:peptide/nickel transport system substrate-binding protein
MTVLLLVASLLLVTQGSALASDPAQESTDADSLPRDEPLYFNGHQWGSVVGWNPYSSSNNNAMAIQNQVDNARVTMFETPYLYNMLDGKVYPLLADGDYTWNDARTELTFKLNAAAKWSDGTPVTAEDVAYTWATHIKYNTGTGAGNKDYIDAIEAVDAQTVVIKAKLDADGKAVNPLIVAAYVSTNYVIQKAWTETLEERVKGDATELLADTAEDVVYSGPYYKFFADDTKVVLVRDDNYWGQDASMWGKLPVPKYLAHTIFKDNAAGSAAWRKVKWMSASSLTLIFSFCGKTMACPSLPTCLNLLITLAPASQPLSITWSLLVWTRLRCAKLLPLRLTILPSLPTL